MSVKNLNINKMKFRTEPISKNRNKKDKVEEKVNPYVNSNGNVDMNQLMSVLTDKIASLKLNNDDIYGEKDKKVNAVDIDFKKELYIGKLDKNAVKSEEIKGKVNNKLDKLKALRKRNGS